MVVYEYEECTICNKQYVGKTQHYLNVRTKQHIYDVWKVTETEKTMDRIAMAAEVSRDPAPLPNTSIITETAQTQTKIKFTKGWKILQKTKYNLARRQESDSDTWNHREWILQSKICMTRRKGILHRIRADKTMPQTISWISKFCLIAECKYPTYCLRKKTNGILIGLVWRAVRRFFCLARPQFGGNTPKIIGIRHSSQSCCPLKTIYVWSDAQYTLSAFHW